MQPNMAITNFVLQCLPGRPPILYGDGTQTRDLTFVEDIVGANVSLLSTDAADGRAVNIGSTDTIEIRMLAELIRDQLDPSLEIEVPDPIAAEADHTHADTGRARELLGYNPSYPIRDGVARFIEWYRENRDWYEPLVLSS